MTVEDYEYTINDMLDAAVRTSRLVNLEYALLAEACRTSLRVHSEKIGVKDSSGGARCGCVGCDSIRGALLSLGIPST